MSENYVSAKIQEALKATSGDKKDAVKLLITWAVRDQALLLGLTKSSLKDTAEERVEAVMRTMKKAPAGAKKAADKDEKPAIQFGDKRSAVKVPPPKISERQASVMHQLAAAFKRNK